MKALINLIYVSRSTEHFHEHEIPDLLQQIRVANAKQEITGMLLYIGGSFLQVLEGQPEAVDAVFSRILRDKRHHQVRSIARESVPERAFEGWTMMHKTLDTVEAGELMLVLEAMKMETNVTAPHAGIVKTVSVKPGDPVKVNQFLLEME